MEENFTHRINCQFKFKCPIVWGLLSPTDQETVRFCEECKREVFLCDSEEELAFHVKEGHCVAIPGHTPRQSKEEPQTYAIGQADAPYG